jgi:UDP-N-acetylmuramate--alanine ligase
MFRGRVRHVHFVGIGGIGMSGLAEILRTLRFDVSGADLKEGETTRRLARLGVRIDLGHRAENVVGADVVVYSSAIAPNNPELAHAHALGIPVITRAEMLAELMRVKYGVAIAGSHGKTTTTSLVATILSAAGFDPTVVVGGRMAALGTNARLGEGDLLVAEADESDGSFLRLTPTIAVVTNIDAEHLDFYQTHERLKDAFVEFVEKVPFYGLAVLCLDHPHVQELLPRIQRRHVTYGLSPQAEYSARQVEYEGTSTRFHAVRRGESLGEVTVRMPGQHNVLNTLAAIAVADELEVPLDVVKEALGTFHGVARRFTVVNVVDRIALVDDYGHHPAEIRATLAAARRSYQGRVLVAFQPHRYTRTHLLFEDFTRAFNDADLVLVADVYPAGERPIAGASGERLARGIAEHGHHGVRYMPDRAALIQTLAGEARPGDVVISLGAGDINRILPELHELLASGEPVRGGERQGGGRSGSDCDPSNGGP